MNIKRTGHIPAKVVPRLSRYYRLLHEAHPKVWISSQGLSEASGFTAAQIRRDLGHFGQFGQPGRGYNVEGLKKSLRRILGLEQRCNVALIGVGNLGMALLGYKGFREQGFDIIAAFDADRRKAGRKVAGVKVFPMEALPEAAREQSIRMAILTVPGSAAQEVAERVAKAGIKAILSFAPVHLKLPETVKVRHIDMSVEIESLSFLISRNTKTHARGR